MLGDKLKVNLTIDDKKVFKKDLKYTFKVIKNIKSYLVEKDVLEYIDDFLKCDDSLKKTNYLTEIIYCMQNGEVDIEEVYNIVLSNTDELFHIVSNLIIFETIEEELGVKEEVQAETNNEKVTFNKWWNNMYCIAIVNLNKSYKEFLSLSPRELKTLYKYYKNNLVDLMLEKEIKLMNIMYETKTGKKSKNITRKNCDNYDKQLRDILVW